MNTRLVETPEGQRPYMDFMPWIVTPTLTGCPSTTAPIGLSATGLPVGIQVMGPFWEDATPIEFAALMAEEIGVGCDAAGVFGLKLVVKAQGQVRGVC